MDTHYQGSISSTLNTLIFCTKICFGTFFNVHVTRKSCRNDVHMKTRAFNVNEIDGSWCQFHQRFTREFFVRMYVLAAFSNYVLALVKNSYEKFARLMLMKLTPGTCFPIKTFFHFFGVTHLAACVMIFLNFLK